MRVWAGCADSATKAMANKLQSLSWRQGVSGVPVLRDVMAYLDSPVPVEKGNWAVRVV